MVDDKVTPERLALFVSKRYGTPNPWQLVERLGIDVKYTPALSGDKLGRTCFPPMGAPLIWLAESIKGSPLKTRVLAHELGHALLHDGTAAYYRVADRGISKAENEAERFALTLLTELYEDETGRLPETISDLENMYGM
ncbi:ImmA/IrrE family metallo-endopeptidase [Lacticaseibacillus zhaodongensis]|uniref:ImmA/IrrE family metallo-endopeptidase n=1 Tax=Lacticaseibacillus zhaodongensis TaxID=2668065 RepID=UPI0018AFFC2C|nr:ImmA/IrrE family metallo-endopeptidase [Lacticaseibacillus zhaodongensis]